MEYFQRMKYQTKIDTPPKQNTPMAKTSNEESFSMGMNSRQQAQHYHIIIIKKNQIELIKVLFK